MNTLPFTQKKSEHPQKLGKFGEDLAAQFLKRHGFQVIERNFKARYGEIDLIALDKQILVFIEVKTRIGDSFGQPEEAVTPYKLREIIKTSQYFKLLHPELPESMRIDVIAIKLEADQTVKSLRHIPNVTL